MKKIFAFSLSLAAVFVMATAFSAHAVRPDLPIPPPIGATIDEFTLPDTNGKDHTLASLKGKNGTVLIFIAVQCPISNAYNERMEKLAQDSTVAPVDLSVLARTFVEQVTTKN